MWYKITILEDGKFDHLEGAYTYEDAEVIKRKYLKTMSKVSNETVAKIDGKDKAKLVVTRDLTFTDRGSIDIRRTNPDSMLFEVTISYPTHTIHPKARFNYYEAYAMYEKFKSKGDILDEKGEVANGRGFAIVLRHYCITTEGSFIMVANNLPKIDKTLHSDEPEPIHLTSSPKVEIPKEGFFKRIKRKLAERGLFPT